MQKDFLNEHSKYMAEKILDYFKETKTYKKIVSDKDIKDLDSIITKLIVAEQKRTTIDYFIGFDEKSNSSMQEAYDFIIQNKINNTKNSKLKKQFLNKIIYNSQKFEEAKRDLSGYDSVFRTLENYTGEFKDINYESNTFSRNYNKMNLEYFLDKNNIKKSDYESQRRIMRKFLRDDLKDIKHQKKGFTFRELNDKNISDIYIEWNKFYESNKEKETLSNLRYSFFKEHTHLTSVEQLKKVLNYVKENKIPIARTMYINSSSSIDDMNMVKLNISENEFKKISEESEKYRRMSNYGAPELYKISIEFSKFIYQKNKISEI